jgi:DNA-binding response OmpR family regulator
VRIAFDGCSGVGLAREWRPDVVLSDLGLPRLDGFGVAKALRPSGVRLIAMSGCLDEEACCLALQCGYKQVLAKPIRPGMLIRLLDP